MSAVLSEPTTELALRPGDQHTPGEGFVVANIAIAGRAHRVIVAPKALGEFAVPWAPHHKLIEGADSFDDSMANTLAMAAAGCDVALRVLALQIGNKRDWCLPSRDVLELLYRHFKPTAETNFRLSGDNPSSLPPGYAYSENVPAQTTVAAFIEGGPEAFEPEAYWSSTQCSASYAWCQHFSNGNQLIDDKSAALRVRAVRLIPL